MGRIEGIAEGGSVIQRSVGIVGLQNTHLVRDTLDINNIEWPLEECPGGVPSSIMGSGLRSKHGDGSRGPLRYTQIAGGEIVYKWKNAQSKRQHRVTTTCRVAAGEVDIVSKPRSKVSILPLSFDQIGPLSINNQKSRTQVWVSGIESNPKSSIVTSLYRQP
jgi:hypothetical protein